MKDAVHESYTIYKVRDYGVLVLRIGKRKELTHSLATELWLQPRCSSTFP